MDERIRLRGIFDEDAERYDRARPGYPGELFDDIATLAGTGPGARVLEIGAGTGKATVPLAARGYRMTCIELGPAMADAARRNLAAYPDVDVVTGTFEDWPLPAEPYDLVVSATAYHWLDPAVRVRKVADALRPGGALAIVETHHVAGGTAEFFAEAQECYLRFDPATPPGMRLLPPDRIPADDAELRASGRFAPATFRRYVWEASYTSAEYLDVLMTYSGHRALPRDAREGLLGCIAQLIDGRYGGNIRKAYLTQLVLAVSTNPSAAGGPASSSHR